MVLAAGYFATAPVRRERENGRQRQCLKNLRQLWSASMMYAQDYDGWMPIYRNDDRPVGKEGVDSDIRGFPSPQRLRASVQPYVKDDSIWFCPSDRRAGKHVTQGSVDHQYSSYYYGFLKPGLLRRDGVVLHNVPKRKVASMQTTGTPQRLPLIMDDPSATTLLGRDRMYGIHLGMQNVIFLDGHAACIRLH